MPSSSSTRGAAKPLPRARRLPTSPTWPRSTPLLASTTWWPSCASRTTSRLPKSCRGGSRHCTASPARTHSWRSSTTHATISSTCSASAWRASSPEALEPSISGTPVIRPGARALNLTELDDLDLHDPLALFREHFYVPNGTLYFDGNSLGLLSREAEQAVLEAM